MTDSRRCPADRRPRPRRPYVAVLALIAWLAALGAAVPEAGVLVGAPDRGDEAFVRVIDGGGEPLEADGEPTRFYVELMLMRAQLRLGRELYRLGDRDAGRAHFIAPADAHLPVVRAELAERGLERVSGRIEALAAAARASDSWIDVQDLYATTRMAIRRAQREVDAELREDAAFQRRVLVAISGRAVRQYEVAVDGAEVVDPVAWRVSWAYARQGERLLETFEGLLRLDDEEAYEQLVSRHARFADLWPDRTPPDRVDTTPADVRSGFDTLAAIVNRD